MEERLSELVSAQTVEDAWRVLSSEMLTYGFDRLLYGFTRFRTKNGLGRREDMLVLSTHEDEYVRTFFDREMFIHAPMTRWASENTGAKSWSYIAQISNELTEEQAEVLAFNRSFGVVAGYTISFGDVSERQKGAIALTAKKGMSQTEVDALWQEHGRAIDLFNQVAHLRITTLPFPGHIRRLSQRQQEVLEWVGEGKTMLEIATIMDLKPATVEKHLRKAREALDVSTTTQAVVKASLHRQLFVTDL